MENKSATLRSLAENKGLYIGAAVDIELLRIDKEYRELLALEFNMVTPENAMKWWALQAEQDKFTFKDADDIVSFARENNLAVRGHTLVWDKKLPKWLTEANLSKDEVEKMTKDAEAHAKEDEEKKESVEARNMADSLIFTAEKSLKDAGDKVSDDIKKEVEEKISALKAVLDTGKKEELEAKTKELSDSLQKVGEAMSKQPAASADSNGEPTQGTKGTEEPKETKGDSKDGEKGKSDEPVEGEVVDEGK